jgi:RimJ/RimL family protein N-acetyltransferase
MITISVRTARLELVPTTLEHLEAELHAPERLAALLGAVVPTGWPPGQYDRDAMQFFHAMLTERGVAAVGWYGWYGIRRATDDHPATLVAGGGYFGPPTADGVVEMGYSVVPDHRRQGYATELVQALTAHALGFTDVRRVVANVHGENVASVTVLERCGFRRIGAGRDPGHFLYEWGIATKPL